MQKLILLAALLVGAASAAPLPHPPLCPVIVYRDYTFAVGYFAAPSLTPSCPPHSVGRLRKSSTQNLKSQGTAYQPIKPRDGAWNVTPYGDDVPRSEKLVYYFSTWEWQTYDGKRWLPAEVR
ncbi:hypothetical protein [Deinococcus sp. UYEF24]